MTEQEWGELRRQLIVGAEVMRDLSVELPKCKQCGCNWPKKNIDANGICPNCQRQAQHPNEG